MIFPVFFQIVPGIHQIDKLADVEAGFLHQIRPAVIAVMIDFGHHHTGFLRSGLQRSIIFLFCFMQRLQVPPDGPGLTGICSRSLQVSPPDRPRRGQRRQTSVINPVILKIMINQKDIHVRRIPRVLISYHADRVRRPEDAFCLRGPIRAFIQGIQKERQKGHIIGERHPRRLAAGILQIPADAAVIRPVAVHLSALQFTSVNSDITKHSSLLRHQARFAPVSFTKRVLHFGQVISMWP